jgi:A/G-specific adenine glycosylase
VASIAFGLPVAAVDTNLRRIIARSRFGREPDEVLPSTLGAEAGAVLDRHDPGAWNQAMMDLGREICRPRRPACSSCPLLPGCAFAAAGRQGRSSAPRQTRFEGSLRQVRGAVVRALRDRTAATIGQLVKATDAPADRIVVAVAAMADEGLVVASPAALAGRPRGTVRLPD